jgi:endonuclease V-like protein UPF0215 family
LLCPRSPAAFTADAAARVFRQHAQRNGHDVILAGTAFAFFASVARQSVEGPTAHVLIFVVEVSDQLWKCAGVEEVIKHDATSRPHHRIRMAQSGPKGGRTFGARSHQLPQGRFRAMLDR